MYGMGIKYSPTTGSLFALIVYSNLDTSLGNKISTLVYDFSSRKSLLFNRWY